MASAESKQIADLNRRLLALEKSVGTGGSLGSPTGIRQIIGDLLAGPGSGTVAGILSPSGVTAASYGDATHVPRVTVDSKGRVTGVVNVAITGGGSGLGDVVGPSSATDGYIALYDGTTGKLIKLGPSPSSFDAAGTAASAVSTHASNPDAHKGQKDSIEIDSGDLHLKGDDDLPGPNKVYGTDGAGAKGWKVNPGQRFYEPLTNGDPDDPELVFSDGECVMVLH